MKFMTMHKMTAELEKGLPPDPGTLEAVGALVDDAIQKKVFGGGEGLKPTSQRLFIAYKNGKRTITKPPFAKGQLIAGFALFKVKSQEEAIGWCDKFAAAVGDMELFLGPVVEPWDLGIAPKPENAPLRFLAMSQMDDRVENPVPPDAKAMATMEALIGEMTKAGVLETTAGLTSTREGARVFYDGSKKTVVDGPFTESKELVAGYAIFDLPSKAVAIEWAKRFIEIVNVHEVEIRPIAEW
jgi:hypothetical protein